MTRRDWRRRVPLPRAVFLALEDALQADERFTDTSLNPWPLLLLTLEGKQLEFYDAESTGGVNGKAVEESHIRVRPLPQGY